MAVEEKIIKSTWMNLCGGMDVCLLCKTTFSFRKFIKAKYYQSNCLWNVSFFSWILPTENFQNVSVKYTELKWLHFCLVFMSLLLLSLLLLLLLLLSSSSSSSSSLLSFKCYLHMLQNKKIILLHWNREFAHRSIPCSFFEWLCLWNMNSGYLSKASF